MKLEDIQQQLQIFIVERKSLVLAIGFIIASVLLIFLAAWPTWSKLSVARADLKKASQQVEQTETQKELLQNIMQDLDNQYDLVMTALPADKQPLANLLRIREVASRSGVRFVDYTLNPGLVSTDAAELEQRQSPVQEFRFKVTLEGEYNQMQQAFKLIEESLPIFSINSYDLEVSNEEATDLEQKQITVDLDLVSYYSVLESDQVATKKMINFTPQQQQTLQKLSEFSLPSTDYSVQPQEFDNQDLFLPATN